MDGSVLKGESYISLASFRRDGTAVETPLWFAELDGRIVAYTDGTSVKVKRIRRNPRVRVAPCTLFGRVTGDWRDGSARMIEGGPEAERIYRSLGEKYGWQVTAIDWLAWLGGSIKRRVALEIVLG